MCNCFGRPTAFMRLRFPTSLQWILAQSFWLQKLIISQNLLNGRPSKLSLKTYKVELLDVLASSGVDLKEKPVSSSHCWDRYGGSGVARKHRMILPVYIIVHISQWHQNIRQCEPMLFYTVVCTVYLKSQKKNSIFISVYLIERRPTGEASGETLQISVCFIRMCFSFSFIFAKMNRYLYILGVFSVLVTLLHLCPPPPFFSAPLPTSFFFSFAPCIV